MARYDIDRSDALPEAELIARAVARDERAVREIIRRHNRRLFRIARSILKDDAEAEDAVQEAYMHAFSALGGFRGGSTLATWLTRIVLNEAMGRLRRRGDVMPPVDDTRPTPPADIIPFPLVGKQPWTPSVPRLKDKSLTSSNRPSMASPPSFVLFLYPASSKV